jgi:hypothetical protein
MRPGQRCVDEEMVHLLVLRAASFNEAAVALPRMRALLLSQHDAAKQLQ